MRKRHDSSTESSTRNVKAVLANEKSYDVLSEGEQALVRAVWARRIKRRVEDLQLDKEFADEGRAWIELDSVGNVVRRDPVAVEPR